MESLTTLARRKPGPRPKPGPKAKSRAYAVYPIDEAAIAWFARERGAESESDALRRMVALVMQDALGENWADKIREAA